MDGGQPYHLLCINLERSADRRAAMERQAADLGLTLEIVPAVLGASLTHDQRRPYAKGWRHLTWTEHLSPTEIGCLMSHRRALKRFLDGPHACAIVLEDDAQLAPEFDATARRLAAMGERLSHVRLLTRIPDDAGALVAPFGEGQALVLKRKWTLGAVATFYTRPAARTILRRTERFFEAYDNIIGRPWLCGETILELRRSIVSTGAFESTIEVEEAPPGGAAQPASADAAERQRKKRERTWWRLLTGLHRKVAAPLALRRWRARLSEK